MRLNSYSITKYLCWHGFTPVLVYHDIPSEFSFNIQWSRGALISFFQSHKLPRRTYSNRARSWNPTSSFDILHLGDGNSRQKQPCTQLRREQLTIPWALLFFFSSRGSCHLFPAFSAFSYFSQLLFCRKYYSIVFCRFKTRGFMCKMLLAESEQYEIRQGGK